MDDQPVLIATVGIPASGKTTWAKEQQARYPTLVRVNKDDLRAMLNDGLEKAAWDHANMLAQARANHAHFVQHLRDEVWDAS